MQRFSTFKLGIFACTAALSWVGCAPVVGAPVRVTAPEGYTVVFPDKADSLRGQDGPVTFRIDSARTPDKTRYEVAWFKFPAAINQAERTELLMRVERGLFNGPTELVKRTQPEGDKNTVDLILDFADGRRGYYHIFYTTDQTMLQVSAVGQRGGEWEGRVDPFFKSVEVNVRGPLPDDPVSAELWRAFQENGLAQTLNQSP
ncbi:MAG: hypothetical protein IPK82_14990 [Polyangiaceae bacterium]|nr:hypothetical protein [Polyangiaceae bacterium]